MSLSSNNVAFTFMRSTVVSIMMIVLLLLMTSTIVSATADDMTSTETETTYRPHILMIVMDDLGSYDLGFHGTGIHTPTIDQLATGIGNTIPTKKTDTTSSTTLDPIYLSNYYVLPYCSPTRAALLSGKYPLHTGLHNFIYFRDTSGLPLREETIANMLQKGSVPSSSSSSSSMIIDTDDGTNNKDNKTINKKKKNNNSSGSRNRQYRGYQTHAIGKWHVGHSSWEQTPTYRGFQSFYGLYTGGQDYFQHDSIDYDTNTKHVHDFRHDPRQYCGEGCSQFVDGRGQYSTHLFTNHTIELIYNYSNTVSSTTSSSSYDDDDDHDDIDSHLDDDDKMRTKKRLQQEQEHPLFLYLAFQAVHCPVQVPDEYTTRYKNRTGWTDRRKSYAGMLSAADEGIYNITVALQETGLWENTLIIFTTDNGGPTTTCCIQGSSNYPKRGGKCSVWEGGTTGDGFLSGPALSKILSMKARKAAVAAAAAAAHVATDAATATTDAAAATADATTNLRQHDDEDDHDGDDKDEYSVTTKKDTPPPFVNVDNNDTYQANNESITTNTAPTTTTTTTNESNQHVQQQYYFNHLFHVVDWLPTIADMIDTVPSNANELDGKSQLEGLIYHHYYYKNKKKNKFKKMNDDMTTTTTTTTTIESDSILSLLSSSPPEPARREIFIGYVKAQNTNTWYGPAIRYGKHWKMIQGTYGGPDQYNPTPVDDGTVVPQPAGLQNATYLLYNITADPSETTNVATSHPKLVRYLITKLQWYSKTYVSPQPNNDNDCPFPGLINTTSVGYTWVPWCKNANKVIVYS